MNILIAWLRRWLASVSLALMLSRAVAGADPTPGVGDTILKDMRPGGAQSIAGATTLANALSAAGINRYPSSGGTGGRGDGLNLPGDPHYFLPNDATLGAPVFGRKHWAYAGNPGGGTNASKEQDSWLYYGLSVAGPAELWVQYKMWMGKVSTDATGIGSNGAFSTGVGHKWDILFRPGSGGTDGRMTAERGAAYDKMITADYTPTGYTGPAAGDDGGVARVNTLNNTGTPVRALPDVPFDPDDPANLNRWITVTRRVRSESAANAQNGELAVYIDGLLRRVETGQYTSHHGFQSDYQWWIPTWINNPFDCTSYVRDVVIWRKTTY